MFIQFNDTIQFNLVLFFSSTAWGHSARRTPTQRSGDKSQTQAGYNW